jgi:hypothetical protein
VKRFFFHIDGAVSFRDIFGTLLSGPEAARAQGLRRWRDLARNHPGKNIVVVVTDEDGGEIAWIRSDAEESMRGAGAAAKRR